MEESSKEALPRSEASGAQPAREAKGTSNFVSAEPGKVLRHLRVVVSFRSKAQHLPYFTQWKPRLMETQWTSPKSHSWSLLELTRIQGF